MVDTTYGTIIGRGAICLHVSKILVENRNKDTFYAACKTVQTSPLDTRINGDEEWAIHSTLKHENIVSFFDYELRVNDDKTYTVGMYMELCDTSLYDMVVVEKPHIRDTFRYYVELLRALVYLHDKNIAHMDVSLQNVFLHNGIVKLGDFGSSIRLDNGVCIQSSKTFNKTFSPPELLIDVYPIMGAKVDIWSSCIVFIILITGYLPWRHAGPDVNSYMTWVETGKLRILPEKMVIVYNVINHALKVDPVKRPSAVAMSDYMENRKYMECVK